MEPRYNELVPDRWVDRFAIAGRAETVLERCRQAAADGADQIAIVFAGSDPETQMQTFAETVIKPMREVVATGA